MGCCLNKCCQIQTSLVIKNSSNGMFWFKTTQAWSKTKTHINSANDDKRQGTTNKQECKKKQQNDNM